ncbi:hypothetical protein [uncultured Pseudokineococcus sp.]|uniref:hypothetical protein n=1 Tax=uncultured Pseudokineococcus sp. TaxID=1642928 RepID=UPI002638CFEC|nr:hypothetical protein [uncultured Pseudokineococcus sp.]
MTTMNDEQRERIRQQVASGRRAIESARLEQERIDETLERSRRVRDRAIPVLRRAGYLR